MAREAQIADVRTPPHNLDLERAVLGSMLLDAETIPHVVHAGTEATDFYSSAHQRIFNQIVALWVDEKPVDLMTVYDQLRKLEQVEEIGGLAYLSSLDQYVTTTTHAKTHANAILEKGVCRELIRRCQETASSLYQDDLDAEGAIDQIDRALIPLKQRLVKDHAVTMDTIMAHLETIRKRASRDYSGISSGLIDLDKFTNGWQPGQLILLAGRPSMGKTALSVVFIRAAAHAGIPVDFFSVEMPAPEIQERMLAQESGIDLKRIQRGWIGQETDLINRVAARLARLPIYIEDCPGIVIRDLVATAEQRKAEQPDIGLIVVDYLQLVKATNLYERQGRFQAVSHVSEELKKLARKLEVPVIACCQLKREVEERPDHKPKLSDLRESGNLEQDADIVIAPFRNPHKDSDVTDDKRPVHSGLVILKQRNGPIGHLPYGIWFHRQTTNFLNVENKDLDAPPTPGEQYNAPPEPKTPEEEEEEARQDDLPF